MLIYVSYLYSLFACLHLKAFSYKPYYTGDQPTNAVRIAEILQIGYELLEVRSGHGLKPIHRTGYTPKGTVEALQAEVREVLAKAFGFAEFSTCSLIHGRNSCNSSWGIFSLAYRTDIFALGFATYEHQAEHVLATASTRPEHRLEGLAPYRYWLCGPPTSSTCSTT